MFTFAIPNKCKVPKELLNLDSLKLRNFFFSRKNKHTVVNLTRSCN